MDTPPDPYRNITDVSEDVLESLAKALENRATEAKVVGIQRKIFNSALEHMGSSDEKVIVDIGCGTGTVSRAMSALPGVVQVIGVDPSPYFLARARASLSAEEASRMVFYEARSTHLPLPDKSADLVMLCHVLTHLDPEEVLPTLVEANRVLRDGGHVLLKDNDLASWSLTLGPTDPLSAPVETFLGAWEAGKYLCRQFPSILAKAGFVPEKLQVYPILDDDEDTYGFQCVLLRSIKMHHALGKCSREMAAAYAEEARRRARDRTFQCLLTYGVCFGYKRACDRDDQLSRSPRKA